MSSEMWYDESTKEKPSYYSRPHSLLCSRGIAGAGLCACPFSKALRGEGAGTEHGPYRIPRNTMSNWELQESGRPV